MSTNLLNILIAEDHRMTAKLLQSVLNKQDNMRVVDVLCNGADVVTAMNNVDVDVLLLDLEMPFMNGFEIMGKLPAPSKSKVLVLSAHTEEEVIRKSLSLGAAGYMSKRVGMNDILDGIRAVSEGKMFFGDNALAMATGVQREMAMKKIEFV